MLFGATGLINTLCVVHQRITPFLAATGVAFLWGGAISRDVTGERQQIVSFTFSALSSGFNAIICGHREVG
jgi:ribose/xylose/arabinose/galactoside ABC-type transport system permease subunit